MFVDKVASQSEAASRRQSKLFGPDAADHSLPDLEGDWPKFLNSRTRVPDGSPHPPPLPGLGRRPFNTQGGALVLRGAAGAVGAVTIFSIAAMLLVSENGRRFAAPTAPRALALPTESGNDPPIVVGAEDLRFAFAVALRGDRVERLPANAAPADLHGLAIHELAELESAASNVKRALALSESALASTESDTSDPVAVMILRNLPDTAAFLAGAPSADGAWVIAANEFDHVVVTALSPQEGPVSTDAELISRSGLPLGTVRLPIRPSAPLLASAGATEEIAASAEQAPAQNEAAPTNVAAGVPFPAARKVPVRNTLAVAEADQKQQRNVRVRSEPASRDKLQSSKGRIKSDAAAAAKPEVGLEAEEAKPKGPLSKFFAWISGKSKPQTPADEDGAGNAFSLTPKE